MKQKKYRKSYERLFKKLPLGIREWAVIEFNRSDHGTGCVSKAREQKLEDKMKAQLEFIASGFEVTGY